MIEGFANSTVVAARWLFRHASPEEFTTWVRQHGNPAALEHLAKTEDVDEGLKRL